MAIYHKPNYVLVMSYWITWTVERMWEESLASSMAIYTNKDDSKHQYGLTTKLPSFPWKRRCQWKNGVVQILGHWVGWGEVRQTRVRYSLIKIQHFIVTIVSKMTFNFIEAFIHRKCVPSLHILFTLLYYPFWYSGAMKISLFFIQSCKIRKSVVHFFIQVVHHWTTVNNLDIYSNWSCFKTKIFEV